jgi:hypothetical protein
VERRADDVDLRTSIMHLASSVRDMRAEFRADIRRLDDRIFQLMLLQIATIASTLVSIALTLAR